jgi:hypothetical protein
VAQSLKKKKEQQDTKDCLNVKQLKPIRQEESVHSGSGDEEVMI